MALQTKTITGSTNSSNWTFKLECVENSTDSTNKTSSLTVTAYIGRPSSSGSYMYGPSINGTFKVTGCADQSFGYSTSGRIDISAGGWFKIDDYTFAVPNNSAGTEITISANFTNSVSPTSGSASGTMTLTTIAVNPTPPRLALNTTTGARTGNVNVSWSGQDGGTYGINHFCVDAKKYTYITNTTTDWQNVGNLSSSYYTSYAPDRNNINLDLSKIYGNWRGGDNLQVRVSMNCNSYGYVFSNAVTYSINKLGKLMYKDTNGNWHQCTKLMLKDTSGTEHRCFDLKVKDTSGTEHTVEV